MNWIVYTCLLLAILISAICGEQARERTATMSEPTIELLLDVPIERALRKSSAQTFCYEPNRFLIMFQNIYNTLFTDVLVEVITIDGKPFSPFSVKGVSTDDFYTHISHAFRHLIQKPVNTWEYDHPEEMTSLLRDLLSSCPYPFALNQNICTMRFSSLGRSCVTVHTKKDNSAKFIVEVKEAYNSRYLLIIAVALFLAYYTNLLAQSKIFQYLAGAFLGVTCGLPLLIVFLLLRLVFHFSPTAFASYMQHHELLVEIFSPILLLSCSVISLSQAWQFRHWVQRLPHHVELSAGYVVLAAFLGMSAIRYLRIDVWRKHALNVSVKWVLRSVTLTLLYNGFASPLHSIVALGVSAVVYIAYAITKGLSPMSAKKQEVKAQLEEQKKSQ